MRLFGFILSAFIVSMAVSQSYASDRQAAYEKVISSSQLLETGLTTNLSLDDLRAQAVIVAEDLKRLAFSETEARVQDKVALSPSLLIDGGASEVNILDRQPGEEVALKEVPLDWFNGHLEKARNSIEQLLAQLDAGGAIGQGEMVSLIAQLEDSLHKMVRPPR